MISVKSINPFKSVIQAIYDIIKAHDRELKVENRPAGDAGKEGEGSKIIMIKGLHGLIEQCLNLP